jgi:Cu+-exporting ATPase
MSDDISKKTPKKARALKSLVLRFILGLLLLIPLFINFLNPGFLESIFGQADQYLEIILLTLIQFGVGSIFYWQAWQDWRRGFAGRETLLVFGTSAIYFWLLKDFLIFSSVGSLTFWLSCAVTLLILGKILEAVHQTSLDINESLSRPRHWLAHVVEKKHQLEMVIDKSISDVLSGQIIMVYPVEPIPLDGVIIWGKSVVDESQITGDVVPVHKKPGDKVFASSQNLQDVLKIKVTQTHRSSGLVHQISDFLQASSNVRDPEISSAHSSPAKWFVPLVMVFAVFVLGFNLLFSSNDITTSIFIFSSILIIAQPKILSLSFKLPVLASLKWFSREGVLFTSFNALKKARKINTLVFEKTGVLTKAEFSISNIIPLGIFHKKEVLRLVAIAERESEHPIAKAIVKFALKNHINLALPKKFEEFLGQGVKAFYDGKDLLVGNEQLMRRFNISLEDNRAVINSIKERAATITFVAYGGKLIGILELKDSLKMEVIETMKQLKKLKFDLVVISGDNEANLHSLLKKTDAHRFLANIRDEDRSLAIEKLKDEGRRVAVVTTSKHLTVFGGADLVLALGPEVFFEGVKADFSLIRNDLREVVKIFEFSYQVTKKIRENSIFSWVYNLLAVIFSVLIFINPFIAALTSILAAQVVFINSLNSGFYRSTPVFLRPPQAH